MIGDLVLEARAITFNYRADEPIVSDWSETFRSGEVVALTGESGRGKSTLLYMLGLMLKPQHGEILVDGAEVAGLGDRRRARLRADVFGFVFQDAALDPSRTVLDNVIETALYRGIPRRNVIADARDLLDQFGVSLRAEHKPGQISGGQAQRIALCRALVNEPRILLADEPTGNLDRGSASTVIDAFHRRAHAGATVIVATHDRALVEQCTRYIQL